MATPARPAIWRAVFIPEPGTGFELHDGKNKRPASMAEIQATLLLLGIRGHIPMPQIQGGRSPALEGQLRKLLGRPGAPSAAIIHEQWARLFREKRAEQYAQYAAYNVGKADRPTNFGIAEAVAYADYERHPERWKKYRPEQYPERAALRVWNAVKPLI